MNFYHIFSLTVILMHFLFFELKINFLDDESIFSLSKIYISHVILMDFFTSYQWSYLVRLFILSL